MRRQPCVQSLGQGLQRHKLLCTCFYQRHPSGCCLLVTRKPRRHLRRKQVHRGPQSVQLHNTQNTSNRASHSAPVLPSATHACHLHIACIHCSPTCLRRYSWSVPADAMLTPRRTTPNMCLVFVNTTYVPLWVSTGHTWTSHAALCFMMSHAGAKAGDAVQRSGVRTGVVRCI